MPVRAPHGSGIAGGAGAQARDRPLALGLGVDDAPGRPTVCHCIGAGSDDGAHHGHGWPRPDRCAQDMRADERREVEPDEPGGLGRCRPAPSSAARTSRSPRPARRRRAAGRPSPARPRSRAPASRPRPARWATCATAGPCARRYSVQPRQQPLVHRRLRRARLLVDRQRQQQRATRRARGSGRRSARRARRGGAGRRRSPRGRSARRGRPRGSAGRSAPPAGPGSRIAVGARSRWAT